MSEVWEFQALSTYYFFAVQQTACGRALGKKIHIGYGQWSSCNVALCASCRETLRRYAIDPVRNVEFFLRRLYSHCREITFGKAGGGVAAFRCDVRWVVVQFFPNPIQQFQLTGNILQKRLNCSFRDAR